MNKNMIIVLLAISLTGCGTIATRSLRGSYYQPTNDNSLFYSGVKMDLNKDCFNIMWLDLPFSAVADTICIPWNF